MLHPSFPGLNINEPFQVEMVTQELWQRSLKVTDIAAVECHPDFTVRIGLLVEAVITEIKALKQLDSGPDVILIAMTERLEELCKVGIAAYDTQQSVEPDKDVAEDVAEVVSREIEDTDEDVLSVVYSR